MTLRSLACGLLCLLPIAVLAAPKFVVCPLNSSCSYNLRGKFNKVIRIAGIKANQVYRCQVVKGNARLFRVRDVHVTPGISYTAGRRFNQPLVIHGPQKGMGYVQFTLSNRNDPWRSNYIQIRCTPQMPRG